MKGDKNSQSLNFGARIFSISREAEERLARFQNTKPLKYSLSYPTTMVRSPEHQISFCYRGPQFTMGWIPLHIRMDMTSHKQPLNGFTIFVGYPQTGK